MARFDRMTVLNRILELGLVPVFYHGDVETAEQVYEPDQLAAAIGDLLESPPGPDLSQMRAVVSLRRRLSVVRAVLTGSSSFDFDRKFGDEDRLTQAVTILALLELYKRGEAAWEQAEQCGPITVRRTGATGGLVQAG